MLSLANWGLPPSLIEAYNNIGIYELHEWQASCVGYLSAQQRAQQQQQQQQLQQRTKWLFYSAPTSGGKSLVAELLALKRLYNEPGTFAIIVLPFRAVVEEYTQRLKKLVNPVGTACPSHQQLHVACMHGGSHAVISKRVRIIVCTIEFSNSIVASMIRDGRIALLRAVVVDAHI